MYPNYIKVLYSTITIEVNVGACITHISPRTPWGWRNKRDGLAEFETESDRS